MYAVQVENVTTFSKSIHVCLIFESVISINADS